MSHFFEDHFEDETEKEKNKKTSEFAQLLEDSFKTVCKSLQVGERVYGEILSIAKDEVFVSTGTMYDGLVPKKDLLDADGKLNMKVGDHLDLYVTHAKDAEIFLSPKPLNKTLAGASSNP